MAKVFIKYNPYKLETLILIDDNKVAENSILNVGSKRLQEWVEQLPVFLQEECNEENFELTFVGTLMDFEDIQEAVKKASETGIQIDPIHLPIKEVAHMEFAIEEVFNEIINGPIEELKTKDLQDAFNKALNDEFEITVVATMSAGKSTLINSLLQRKIMPSSQEACTATISRIKDTDDEEFFAIAYDDQGNKITSVTDVQLESMAKLNADETVSTICLEGNIPFTSSDEMSLVLIDTPGPNNSRDESHLKTTFKNLDESSKALVLYILNATQLGVNDDSKLLDAVANSMKVGGKQSKDRYLFVVNKLDQFRKGDDNVEVSLAKVRKYLADRGIHEPNLFPTAALSALDIRGLLNNPSDIDEDLEDEILMTARKLNRNNQLHLEKYATLTPSIKRKLQELYNQVDDGDIGNLSTALIHSGIPAVEETIKLYVEKYARTAKIKNVVDTFQKKLESSKAFEVTKNLIAESTERHEQIKNQIKQIKEKLNSGEEAEQFKKKIDALDVLPQVKKESKKLLNEQQQSIDEFLTGTINEEFTHAEADTFINNLTNYSKQANAKLSAGLEKIINEQLVETAMKLLNEYKDKIVKLIDGMNREDLIFEPFELIAAEIDLNSERNRIIDTATFTERVKVGTETYRNPEREGFFGKLKFWKKKELTRDVYEEIEKIKAQVIADEFVTLLEEHTRKLVKETENEAKEKMKLLKFDYHRKFEQVDQILRDKLNELGIYTADAESIQQLIQESKEKLAWLERIEQKVNNIIEIEEVVYS
ncbi:dynamin family protein [Psychrobacillus sp. NEAU-3TGS]|uniref:dynamin family protein n=1 Tax=Psychrobacillus sp. NEAU-3TGS TaxID=2995412 RepID=UPI0024980368|nr:dynamin family protein [Psychrobacillus sp. NEAU-3TGS]MDI2587628.1 dynamin family protein [Psychrobacillus sp. NEAU-3TGS]